MVRAHVCRNGQWEWPDQPEFCQQWQNCRFTPPDALYCNNNGIGNGKNRLPGLLDHRLKDVTVVGYPSIERHTIRGSLPNIVNLNLSRNAIKDVALYVLYGRPLRVLDLSHNRLREIRAQILPPYGSLREVYLEGNPLKAYSPVAFAPAMGGCAPALPNGSVPRALTDRNIEAPECKLEYAAAVFNLSPLKCVTADCDSPIQPRPRLLCGDGPQDFSLVTRCDGVHDCRNKEDERDCSGTFAQVGQVNLNATGALFCVQMDNLLAQRYTITHGLMLLGLTSLGKARLATDHAAIPLVSDGYPFVFQDGDVRTGNLQAAFAYGTVSSNVLSILINGSTVGDDIVTQCMLQYQLLPDGASSTTTAADFNRMTAGSQAVPAAAVAVPLAALVILSVILVIFYARRSANRLPQKSGLQSLVREDCV